MKDELMVFPFKKFKGYMTVPSNTYVSKGEKIWEEIPGMTLRQWYAGLAMTRYRDPLCEQTPERLAEYAFKIADAMIEKGNKSL